MGSNMKMNVSVSMKIALVAALAAVCVAVASASTTRQLLQDPAPAQAPAPAPGFYPYAGYGSQYFNPSWWAGLYQQAIPYNFGARWVNRNTPFRAPLIGLPGIGQAGNGGSV